MRNLIKIVGGLFLLLGIFFPIFAFTKEKIDIYQEEIILEEDIENNKYYAVLEIPKIHLKRELYQIESPENNVDENVLLHEESVLPGGSNSNLILAAHSGYGKNAYFKDLYQLELNDVVSIYYDGKLWTYEIREIEYQEKTGVLYLKEDYPNMITLITCTKNNHDTQTIYYGVLKNSQNL